jgi:glycosyltransferase involved in cell wall biosynthesis
MEAMAVGVPVVATRTGAIPELVVHDETGLLVEAADTDGLAAAILRVIQDASLARRLAANARCCIEADFDLDKNTRRLDDLLTAAIQKQTIALPTGGV